MILFCLKSYLVSMAVEIIPQNVLFIQFTTLSHLIIYSFCDRKSFETRTKPSDICQTTFETFDLILR